MTEPQTLAELLGQPDTASALEDLRTRYINAQPELERRNHSALLDAQLAGTGSYAVTDLIDRAFTDPLNRLEHRVLVGYAEVNPLVRRIADEQNTLYDTPPDRRVGSGQERFDRLVEDLALDLTMRAATEKLITHHGVLLSPRVRDGVPLVDVLSPACFSAVSPVSDPTSCVAIITDIPTGPKTKSSDPHFQVQTPWQVITLNRKGELLYAEDSPTPGYLPVLITLSPAAAMGRLLPERPSLDVSSAETSGAFQYTIALRESLTVQKQAYLSGDTSALAMGQSAGSQREVVLGEGVSVTAVDRSVDVLRYLDHADRIADTACSNHGLAPSTRKLATAGSGYELWLRAQPLVRLRRRLVDVLRPGERLLAEQLARVIDAAGLDEYRFTPSPYSIRYGEISMPASEAEQLALFETRRRLGITDTIEEVSARNQITDEQAADEVALHAEREVARVAMLQDLSRMNASSSTAVGDSTNGNREPAPAIAGEGTSQ